MGNALCGQGGAVKPAAAPATAKGSVGHSVSQTSRSSFASRRSFGGGGNTASRMSSEFLHRVSAAVRGKERSAAVEAATKQHALDERLAEAIKAKAAAAVAAADSSAPRRPVTFNRLLLRFGTLHEGFAASRAAFRQLCGSEEGEMSHEQLRAACAQLGYHLDEATLDQIFAGADRDKSNSLNVHEFLAVLAILHTLKGPQDQEQVDPAILATWGTVEEAFSCFASSAEGYISKEELLGMMHEGATDGVRHSSGGTGGDPIRSIAQRRFAELDREGNGRVSFLEFLFCLEGWVDDAEEDVEGPQAA